MDDFDDMDNNPFLDPEDDSSKKTQTVDKITGTSSEVSESNVSEDHQVRNDPASNNANANPNMNVDNNQKENEDEREQKNNEGLPERTVKKKVYDITIKVTTLQRAGSVTNKKENPTIIFDVATDLPLFRKRNYRNIKKTMDEFHQLFKYLNAAIQESFIPSLPSPFTNYCINNREDLEKTVSNFQNWFDRIIKDPLVIKNEEFVHFIECDCNTYIPIRKANLIASGLKRKTLKQLPPPYDETLDLAAFRPMVKDIHWNAKEMQTRLLNISKAKKMLSQYENTFGKGFIGLSEIARDTEYSDKQLDKQNVLYNHFGKIITTVGDIDSIIATLDIATLYDGLEWIVNDTYVVKEALTNRHLLMRELLKAQQSTKSKQEQARKLRAKRDTNPVKVEESIQQLKEASKLEQQLTLKLERITANMLIERKGWIEWYETQLRTSIKEYTLRKIEYERKKLVLLEKVRRDVRHADKNGGLSRLGREHLLNKTDDDVKEKGSQLADGDSWAGDSSKHDSKDVENINHTEFDSYIDTEDPNYQKQTPISNNKPASPSLDPKSAATLLGECIF
ncbi:hypothetical protein TPHA_0J02730 [Tetrapisispora phaffii CBS 4417]|uniref:Vacuolar protein sorting-associated protein 17 n=1 Tax=Tetrapisispora phaffii (strain ATCC 24235 / CBS 4417 / NBRC 1672 / NRRL Y-8282 / UCD 70-5) TaxID=1071381 RepID=G8BZ01_TETPH|nr:hypothetical protein TPHA_0J02730 [Tetrapisispora phaffii CBS 4417]CCE65093.1 hypothetical protein TPHA_0J02730 [Tetrapisispora phaffii CBS 4417]